MKQALGAIVLAVASTMGGLGAAELWARHARPKWEIVYPPRPAFPDVFQEWPPFGYRLWPLRDVPAPRFPGLSYRANREGFRGHRDLDEPDPRPRVVVLGDSMVFGAGVAESDRFTDVLEAQEPGWRVDNLGMIGFGPDLMLRAFVAVLGIYTDDLRRVVEHYQGPGLPLPRFRLVEGRLVTVPYPEPRWWERLRLVQGINFVRWRSTESTFPLNAAILARFVDRARAEGIIPAVVFVPAASDGPNDRRRRRWLAARSADLGVAYLDLTEALRAGGAICRTTRTGALRVTA